jgi:hypothetical protein
MEDGKVGSWEIGKLEVRTLNAGGLRLKAQRKCNGQDEDGKIRRSNPTTQLHNFSFSHLLYFS